VVGGVGVGRVVGAKHPIVRTRSCSLNRSFQGINILHQPPLLLILSQAIKVLLLARDLHALPPGPVGTSSISSAAPGQFWHASRSVCSFLASQVSSHSKGVVPVSGRRGPRAEPLGKMLTPMPNTTRVYVDLLTLVRTCVLLIESQDVISYVFARTHQLC
jgi:hypothetical protein